MSRSRGSVDLSMIVRVSTGDGTFTVSDIPEGVWDEFREKATASLPEKGDRAWASVLLEFMGSFIGGDGVSSPLIMTDVPVEVIESFTEVASRVGMTHDEVHAALLRSAGEGRLRMVRFNDGGAPQPGAVVLLGVRDTAVSHLERVTGLSLERFLGLVVTLSEQGLLRFSADEVHSPADGAVGGQGPVPLAGVPE